ncbi:MAG: glycogen synthase [Myxococcales bacterium]|nr:glycogen synthase [Myxococcales bacterium]
MRIAFAAAELTPWVSTGGLGEVVAALPKALAALGHDVAVYVPLYRQVRQSVGARGARLVDTGAVSHVWMGGHRVDARVFRIAEESRTVALQSGKFEAVRGDHGTVNTYAVDCPVLFDRDGIYGHSDDAARFSTFARAVLNTAHKLLGGHPDIIHAHDWHTALLPVYLEGPYRRLLPTTASVVTIHNLAYQGLFPLSELSTIGLDRTTLHPEKLEFFGHLNWLKGGIAAADAITTVSPRYAEEIRTPEFGERLDGVLNHHSRRLFGILNGIDTDQWNPSKDKYLSHKFSAADLKGKDDCRRTVLAMANMDGNDRHPVFGIVSRLSRQKGLDLLADLVPYLASRSVRVILLGKGEPALEGRFEALERQFSDYVRVRIGFEPDLAHVLQAGADAILMPSRYEPCGLTQMYAMRYGTLPIVRAVGGLFDSVVPATNRTVAEKTATGFTYDHDTHAGLQWAIDRALEIYYGQPEVWRQMQQTAMAADFSWKTSARRYVDVYRLAQGKKP